MKRNKAMRMKARHVKFCSQTLILVFAFETVRGEGEGFEMEQGQSSSSI
jgi:hypothetical protein